MGIFKDKSKKISPVMLDELVNNMPDIILISDYEGNIETANKGEIVENFKTLNDFFRSGAEKDLSHTIMTQVQEKGIFSQNIDMVGKDSASRMHVTAVHVPSEKKVIFDIMDEESSLRREKELIGELEKQEEILKSKDLFIANLSHEIKTPMNIIVGMIYFLKSTMLNEQQIEYINKLDEASKLLLEMTSGVLSLSEEHQYASTSLLVDFNMNDFLDGVIEAFKERASAKGVQLYTNLQLDDVIDIHADKSKINQIFVNLIDNAIKYTDKGFVELSARKVEETNVSYTLQFCIKDTGIGIKKEDSLKIFREFSQAEDPTKRTQDGKGIGLAIVKKIVEDMNGKIWVESSVGLGSKFYFSIVVDKCSKAPGKITDVKETYTKPSMSVNRKMIENREKRILLVEDNPLNIEITKKVIEQEGYVCDVAEDGIICIKRIQEVGTDYYNLILMDIHMPKYNGYEISKILRHDFGVSIPIVALTATNVTEKSIKENENYITDYILKPVVPEELKEKLRAYFSMESKMIENESKKENILLIGLEADKIQQLKDKLYSSYEVISATNEIDIEILLQAGTLKAILVDEFDDLDKEISIISNIRRSPSVSDIPIVLISRNKNSNLKERSYEVRADGVIENSEIDQCAVALYNILKKAGEKDILKSQIEKSKTEIENVYNFLFDSMVNLTSARSKETGEHLKRTKEYMKVMLAKYEEFYREGLFTSKEMIEEIAMAAVLHDIGKVGIPDEILNKPGKLTDEEYEIMKSHTTIGKEILETTYGNKVSNNILNYAKDIVFHHHEKYDGTGYPEHLKGEEISVISRIMGLGDVFDALANKRVYKPALPYEEIDEYIKSQSGKAFDPKVVNIYSMVKDKMIEINEAYKDQEH
ncbi:MAG: response regulator [Clostridia bacterium]|nr:response regulator [Clostridia bacterium]